MASSSVPSLPVIFTTKTQYPLPTQKFMIPSTWKRYQLSQLVNKALSLTNIIPFDFLIHGEVLRASLGEWNAEKGAGEEETLEIEYIESLMPPQKMSSLPHEDWVSSISCQVSGHFLTSSYDGNVRLFDYTQKLQLSAPIHAAPITAVCAVPSSSPSSMLLATASHDLTARLTQLTLPDASSPSDPPQTQTLASMHLHTAPLSSIAANPAGTHLLSSSWDGLIGLWDTTTPENDEVPYEAGPDRQKKRRRVAGDDVKRKAPAAVLKSHTARVSKVIFGDDGNSAVSCGFDSTVRVWDIENGVCTSTINASEKPFLAMALPHTSGAPQTALAASTDRTVTLFDLRTTATASAAVFVHPATPAALAFSEKSGSQQFVSGAYDGVVRLWDLRSTAREMSSFRVWEDKAGRKVLGVDWARGVVGIAGEGGVEVWRVSEGGSEEG
ncbi:WD40 repeat-like protein [Amylostereum chailletii]|nr:WD40 repeat-like protein [Amylostereum chailletii]